MIIFAVEDMAGLVRWCGVVEWGSSSALNHFKYELIRNRRDVCRQDNPSEEGQGGVGAGKGGAG